MATRQLASRARRRVQEAAPTPDVDLRQQREVVDTFLAAAREGDFDALLAVLDPEVVVRADWGAAPTSASQEMRGAREVAEQALAYAQLAPFARPALVNGAAGIITAPGGHLVTVMGFTVRRGAIVAIDTLADPVRLRQLDPSVLDD